MPVEELIRRARARLTKLQQLRALGIVVAAFSYALITGVLAAFVSFSFGASVFVLVLAASAGWAFRRGIFRSPSAEDASALIDAAYNLKDRASTYTTLGAGAALTRHVTDPENKRRFIAAQIERIVPEFNAYEVLPFKLSYREKGVAASAAVALLAACALLAGVFSSRYTREEAKLIQQLIKQESALPEPVKESLQNLADTIEQQSPGSDAVLDAIKNAEAEIAAAEEELKRSHQQQNDEQKQPQTEQLEPQQAEPPPQEQERRQQTAEEQKQEEQTQDQKQPQQRAQQKQEQKKDDERQKEQQNSQSRDSQNSQQDQNQSGKQGQQSQSAQQQKSDSGDDKKGQNQGSEKGKSGNQGKGSSNSENQANNSNSQGAGGKQGQGSDSPQGDNKQGNNSGRSASQSGDNQGKNQDGQEGKQNGQGASQTQGAQKGNQSKEAQALNKAESAVAQIKQGLEKEKEGQDQKGNQGAGGTQGENGAKPDKLKQGRGSRNQSGDKQEPKSEPGAAHKHPGEKEKGPDKAKSGPGHPKDPRSSDENKSMGGDSALPDKTEGTREMPAEGDGPPGEGIRGKKGFKETQIKGEDEKLDARFTEKAGELTLNKKEAEAKTSLSDVKLAKPEAAKDEQKQPIPLEYRDILE